VRPAAAAALLTAALLAAGPAAARAADDPYAALLAPPGTCASDTQLNLSQDAASQAMLCLTNYARAQSGLAPLQLDASLQQAGRDKLAADVSCGEFSHTPCGNPFEIVFAAYLAGATGYSIGENIAWGTGSYGTPRYTMDAWLHSTGHRENILTAAFRDLGVGYLPNQTFQGYAGATLWSQEFGVRTPASGTTQPPPSPPPPSPPPPTPPPSPTPPPPAPPAPPPSPTPPPAPAPTPDPPAAPPATPAPPAAPSAPVTRNAAAAAKKAAAKKAAAKKRKHARKHAKPRRHVRAVHRTGR
jgi:uncharacterized protein YkwD